MTTLQIMAPEESTLLNSDIKLKDVLQLILIVITGTALFVTMSTKLDGLTSAIADLKDSSSKQSVSNDLAIKALQNQVNSQGVQISLQQKDIDALKAGKK